MKITTCQPVEGVRSGQTIDVDDERGAWLVANGYATKADQDQADDGLEELTVAELRQYAADHGIDLGDARRKDDIFVAIRKAEAS